MTSRRASTLRLMCGEWRIKVSKPTTITMVMLALALASANSTDRAAFHFACSFAPRSRAAESARRSVHRFDVTAGDVAIIIMIS